MKFFLIVMLYNSNFTSGPYDTKEACEEVRQWVIQQALSRGYRGTEQSSRCHPS